MELTIDQKRFSEIKLWILIPAAGDLIHSTFCVCLVNLIKLLRQYEIHADLLFMPGDSLVTRARNNLADMFMAKSSDPDSHFALWLDCDILFEPESVIQMLALDRDFVAAPYSKKGLHKDRMAEAARLNWPSERMTAAAGTPNVNWVAHPVQVFEPFPVLEAGSGFWLMKRKVLMQMQAAHPEIKYKRAQEEIAHYGTDHSWDYFHVGVWPETGEYLSEDWWFCRTWRNLGGTLYCCFWIKTQHIGPFLYPMDMPAIAELLNTTGGYINGPTKQEKPHVEGRTDITRVLKFIEADKAAVAGHSG